MNNKMKMTILLGGLNTGGAERVAVSFSNYLIVNNADVEITFVLFNENKSLYDIDERIKVVELLSNKSNVLLNFLNRRKKLREYFNKENPDIILTFFEKMSFYALSTKNKESVLISSDRGNIKCRSFFRQLVCRYTAKRCDGFIFQTNSAKACYSKNVQKHSIVIPNAVSTYAEVSKNKDNVISAMGRLTEQKGFDSLIKAFSLFCKKNDDYILNIYGDGADKDMLQNLVNSFNIQNKVNFMGNKKDAIKDISKSKLFVLSSRYEGMPNALLEAMASGVASISTDCPFGPNEIIEDEKNGLLVKVDDIDDMSSKMLLLANNEELRKKLEQEAIKVRDSHNPKKIFSKYYEYMSKVLYNKQNKKCFSLRLFEYLRDKKLLNILSDKLYAIITYYVKFKKHLNLRNPKSFNEKLQWLKLYDRKDIYTKMVDKYEAKEYVKNIIGEKYIISTLGIYDNFDDIDFDKLPNQFVLKCTHDSGGLVIVKNKKEMDYEKAKNKINKCLKRNYYIFCREWPYKDVKPRIIAEKYFEDKTVHELRDYKFFCFNGVPKFFKIDFDRQINHRANYYDIDGNLLKFGEVICPPDYDRIIDKPKNLKLMIDLAKKLSKNISFIRVDFYESDGNVYFGELTFYPASGFGKFIPEEWDYKIGEWIDLSVVKKNAK